MCSLTPSLCAGHGGAAVQKLCVSHALTNAYPMYVPTYVCSLMPSLCAGHGGAAVQTNFVFLTPSQMRHVCQHPMYVPTYVCSLMPSLCAGHGGAAVAEWLEKKLAGEPHGCTWTGVSWGWQNGHTKWTCSTKYVERSGWLARTVHRTKYSRVNQ